MALRMTLSLTLRRAVPVFMLLACTRPGFAEEPAEIALTVSGPAGTGAPRVFGRDALSRLRQVTYRTSTIWTDGVLELRGVPLSEVLRAAGLTGGTAVLRASNDYVVQIPLSTVLPDVPLVAFSLDGKAMSLRDKGPLWLVYPYDSSAAYQTEVIYTRSIWQLEAIEVDP